MATDCIAQTTFRFQENSKPVIAAFDMGHASSDCLSLLAHLLWDRVWDLLTPFKPRSH
jgi:hypothetical protein